MVVSIARPSALACVVLNPMSKMRAAVITNESARGHSVPCAAPVMVDAGQFWCTGHGAEVSTEELTVTDVRSPIEVGTGVDVYFELDGLVAIEGRAVVTRAEADRVTLQFLDLDADAVHALEDYVSGGFHSSTHIRQRPLAH
jgi:PilZ domain